MAGSSGGVKSPHSDTPSAEKQQTKKSKSTQVRTMTHKEAATGIKMAIIHKRHPDMTLYQSQADIIQDKVSDLVEVHPVDEAPPQFLHSRYAQGIVTTTCANESTKIWLMQTVESLGELWEGMELKVVEFRDLPKSTRVLVRVPGIMEATKVLTRLKIQNTGLNTADWAVMSRKVVGREQTLSKNNIPVMEHPPYSPHLASCDFFLFPKIKSALKETRFESVDAVKAKATQLLKSITRDDLQHCFQQWKIRMKRCRNRGMDYIEGDNISFD
jgi:hypothetical protein